MYSHQKFSEAKKIDIPVDARQILKNDYNEIILISLQKDEEIAVHDNPFDVSFIGIEGKAELTLDGKKMIVEQFDTITISNGHQRGLKNSDDKTFKVAVIKKLI